MFPAFFTNGERIKERLSLAVTGIITTSFSLIILGTFVLVYLNIIHLSASLFHNANYSIFLEEQIEDQDRDAIVDYLNQIKGVKDIRIIPAAELREELLSDYGSARDILDDAIIASLPNVIDFSIDRTKKVTPEQLVEIESLSGVEEFVSGRETQAQIKTFFNISNFVGIFLIAILIISEFFIISNSIQIAIRVRLKEIKILKTLGATDSFIRNPFIMEGALISIVSFFFAVLTIYFLYRFILAGITFNQATYQIKEMALFFNLHQLAGTFLLICVTGICSSILATNKILKHLKL